MMQTSTIHQASLTALLTLCALSFAHAAPEPRTPVKRGEEPGFTGVLEGRVAKGPLEITSSLESEGGNWVARWTLHNTGKEPLYIAAHLPQVVNGRLLPSRTRFYLRAEESTLYVTKRMWRIPRGVRPLVSEIPFLRKLEPGEKVSGGLRLPASVASDVPYATRARRLRIVNRVQVSFGYFLPRSKPEASKRYKGLYTVSYAQLKEQRFAIGEHHAARLSVR